MSLQTIETNIDTMLAGVQGLTATPEVLTLTVQTKDLPAATTYFAGYGSIGDTTGDLEERESRFRVDIEFLLDPAKFRAQAASLIPAIYAAHAADRSLNGSCLTSRIEDGGEFQLDNDRASAVVAIKTLYIVAETEEVT